MKKKLLSFMLAVLMAFSVVPMSVFTAFATTLGENWENCTACSEANPHIISTKAELNKIREHKNTTANVIDGYFKLANDIVFEAADFAEGGDYYGDGDGWLAIGHNNIGGAYGSNNGISFNGSFDGNNKTISGIQTHRPSNVKKYNGLFAFLAGNAKVFDVTLSDFYIGGDMSGILTGMVNSANALVDNVTVIRSTVETIALRNMASGILIGKLQGGTVQNINIIDCDYVGNSWGSGYIVGLIQNAAVKNVLVDRCDMSSWTKNGLFTGAIQGEWVQIENVEIKNSCFVQGNSDSFAYFAPSSGVSNREQSWIKNVSIDLDVQGTYGLISEYKNLFSGNNDAIPMENVRIKVDFDVVRSEDEYHETGSTEMQIEGSVIYVINQTNAVSKIASDDNGVLAYTNGGSFASDTVFEDGALAAPVRERYRFEGWYTNPELTTPLTGAPAAGASYYAKWEELPVAMIGEVGYETLQDAIDHAASGEEIKLAFDIAETDITVAADDNVIIDLGGHTVTGDFMVHGKAIIRNGTILNTAVVSGIESNGASADLTLEDLTVVSNRHALRIDGGKAYIISGTYTSTAEEISAYAVNAGGDVPTSLIIDGGVFTPSASASTQGTALMLKNEAVTTVINGGVFKSAGSYSFENYGEMEITGGAFEAGFVANDTTVIFGGSFESNPSAYLAEGLESVPVNGTYVIQDKRAFAVTADKEQVAVGETVTVTVTLNGTELVGAEWTFVYDSNAYELVSSTLGENVMGNADGWAIPAKNATFAASEILATYTLKAKVQAPVAASAFCVTNTDAWNIYEANGKDDTAIPGDATDAPVEIVDPEYLVEVGENDYVAGKKLVLVYTNSEAISFAYAGATMYDVSEKYTKDGYARSYAIVVDAIDGDYAENVTIVYGTVAADYVIAYDAENIDYDLNDSGEFNLRDVTAAFGVYNGAAETFAGYMNIVLNADVDADGFVGAYDLDAFVQAYQAN